MVTIIPFLRAQDVQFFKEHVPMNCVIVWRSRRPRSSAVQESSEGRAGPLLLYRDIALDRWFPVQETVTSIELKVSLPTILAQLIKKLHFI